MTTATELQRLRKKCGLTPQIAKKRVCSFCGVLFDSEWCGHRTCAPCKAKIKRSGIDDEIIENSDEFSIMNYELFMISLYYIVVCNFIAI